MNPDERGIPRRAFLKSAVAIGGASALAACVERDAKPVPNGTENPSSLPKRQHAWNRFLAEDEAGNTVQPHHHVLLHLSYVGDVPTDHHRQIIDTSLETLERAYEFSNEGLVFTLGYSPAYFDSLGGSPVGVDLPAPRALSDLEDPKLDTQDAFLHLASDRAKVVLAAEQGLRGERETLNGVSVDTTFTDAFSVVDRRTGFIGPGLPASHQDTGNIPESEPVPEESPLYMGFKSNYTKSQATEDRVTIQSGPFAGGTTMHSSHMFLGLEQWYEQDSRDQRVSMMFCPAHAESNRVEGVGKNLGTSPHLDECAPAEESAEEKGIVGHAQKLEAVREDGRPIILRRDFDSTNGGRAGVQFVAIHRQISDFEKTRERMNARKIASKTAVGRRRNNGIRQYLTVTRRGNYLLPPRPIRALPTPEGQHA